MSAARTVRPLVLGLAFAALLATPLPAAPPPDMLLGSWRCTGSEGAGNDSPAPGALAVFSANASYRERTLFPESDQLKHGTVPGQYRVEDDGSVSVRLKGREWDKSRYRLQDGVIVSTYDVEVSDPAPGARPDALIKKKVTEYWEKVADSTGKPVPPPDLSKHVNPLAEAQTRAKELRLHTIFLQAPYTDATLLAEPDLSGTWTDPYVATDTSIIRRRTAKGSYEASMEGVGKFEERFFKIGDRIFCAVERLEASQVDNPQDAPMLYCLVTLDGEKMRRDAIDQGDLAEFVVRQAHQVSFRLRGNTLVVISPTGALEKFFTEAARQKDKLLLDKHEESVRSKR